MAQQADPASRPRKISFVQTLRNRKTRCSRSRARGNRRDRSTSRTSTSISVRLQLGRDQHDLDAFGAGARQKALSDANLKGSTSWSPPHRRDRQRTYNQDLSERRADSIKRYLTEKYGINGTESSPSATARPSRRIRRAARPINRRVQVVNMDTKTARSAGCNAAVLPACGRRNETASSGQRSSGDGRFVEAPDINAFHNRGIA